MAYHHRYGIISTGRLTQMKRRETINLKFNVMAKYSKGAQEGVRKEMHKLKEGTLKSGSGKKVTSTKQAIAIGLSEARKKGAKVPSKSTGRPAKRSAKSGRRQQ